MDEDEDFYDGGEDYEYDDGGGDYEYQEDMDDEAAPSAYQQSSSFPFLLEDLPLKNHAAQRFVYKLLEDVCKQLPNVDLQWQIGDKAAVYRPVLTFGVQYAEQFGHSLRLVFHQNDSTERPFQIHPIASMAPVALFSVIFHPLLTKEWSPFHDWGGCLAQVGERLRHFEFYEPIAGGELVFDEADAVPLSSLAVEALLVRWYRHCTDAVPFDAWSDGNVFAAAQSTATVARLAKLTPKYVRFQGIGYGGKDTAAPYQHPTSDVVSALCARLGGVADDDEAVARWLGASPLYALLVTSLREFNGVYLPQSVAMWRDLFRLLTLYERWQRRFPAAMAGGRDDFDALYRAFCGFFAQELHDGNAPVDVQAIVAASEWCRAQLAIVEQSLQPPASSSALPPSIGDGGGGDGGGDAAEDALHFVEGQRVYLNVPNLLKHHHFRSKEAQSVVSSSGKRRASSSSMGLLASAKAQLMRELRFLRQELLPQITLFVADESLQHMVFTVAVDETPDNPYYGGLFVFHLFVPDDYPAQHPLVRFVTTRQNTVRFNPNLYADGKVCLSLLGTWSGPSWQPETSSLQQLLTSIYFLIFTEEPFFNEPGYETNRAKYAKESAQYSLDVRRHVVTASLEVYARQPCAILGTWTREFMTQRHWPRLRDWFYAQKKTYGYPTAALEAIDAAWWRPDEVTVAAAARDDAKPAAVAAAADVDEETT